MKRILIVDDDQIILALARKILENAGYEVVSYSNSRKLLDDYKPGLADLIISDLNMPSLSGPDLIIGLRKTDSAVPIIVLTSSDDIGIAIELFKTGVRDYLIKPIVPEEMVHRIESILTKLGLQKELERIEQEKSLIELENEKLVNWRLLYALKDITQTEQMIKLFTRSVNASGGYMWLDLLQELPKQDDGSVNLDAEFLNLIIESVGTQRKTFDYLTFISLLPTLQLVEDPLPGRQFILDLVSYTENKLQPLAQRSKHNLMLYHSDAGVYGKVVSDRKRVYEVLDELVINAIKYSPAESAIFMDITTANPVQILKGRADNDPYPQRCVAITMRNVPRLLQAKDKKGNQISGIPYDYSELIFDLFYTLEAFPTTHPEEEWPHGTGLFVARSLARRMGGWLECKTVVDYTGAQPQPLVQFTFILPLA
jgi:DNA-binding response OmpR family regulator